MTHYLLSSELTDIDGQSQTHRRRSHRALCFLIFTPISTSTGTKYWVPVKVPVTCMLFVLLLCCCYYVPVFVFVFLFRIDKLGQNALSRHRDCTGVG